MKTESAPTPEMKFINARMVDEFLGTLATNWNNSLNDNFDFSRFGKPERDVVNGAKNLEEIRKHLEAYGRVYDLFEDDTSRYMFIQILAYRVLGHRKFRLPLSTEAYWTTIMRIEELGSKEEHIDVVYPGSSSLKRLHSFDLQSLGIPVKIFNSPKGIVTQFLIRQYQYKVNDICTIGVKEGDVVIDGGACWGDTTLHFANLTGRNGRVYAFEFIPNNLCVLKRNIALNQDLVSTIRVIEKPLWHASNLPMYYSDNGPGSRVSLQPFEAMNGDTVSISIDDFVKQESLNRVDFIKMDIEGSEANAIRGAERTLKEFRPQLALSVYHNFGDDLARIATTLADMNLGYKFFLDHFTIHHEETVLFATADI